MTKSLTITLQDLPRIEKYVVDLINEKVIVFVQILKEDGSIYQTQEHTYWVTMPPQMPIYDTGDPPQIIGYEPYPETWHQLPSGYAQTLQDLADDAASDLAVIVPGV